MEHVILDQIRTAVLKEGINKHVDKYFQSSKAAEALRKRKPRNNDLFAPIASFVGVKKLNGTMDQHKVRIIGSTSMAKDVTRDTAIAAEALCKNHRLVRV